MTTEQDETEAMDQVKRFTEAVHTYSEEDQNLIMDVTLEQFAEYVRLKAEKDAFVNSVINGTWKAKPKTTV